MPFWQLYYHLVWAVRERQPLITPEGEKTLYSHLALKTGGLRGVVFAIGGTADHIHLVAAVPPSLAVARFVSEIKGGSSYHLNRLPGMENGFAWQRGYGAVSFGHRQMERVIAYARRQKKHHTERNLISALERTELDSLGYSAKRKRA